MDSAKSHCLVAQFSDGSRQLFYGSTEEQAVKAMDAAQAQCGEITYWDGVTDLDYEKGVSRDLLQEPPTIPIIDLTECVLPIQDET